MIIAYSMKNWELDEMWGMKRLGMSLNNDTCMSSRADCMGKSS